jgi:hypothetical protein
MQALFAADYHITRATAGSGGGGLLGRTQSAFGTSNCNPQCKTAASIQTQALKQHQRKRRVCLTTAAMYTPLRKQPHTRPVYRPAGAPCMSRVAKGVVYQARVHGAVDRRVHSGFRV